MINKISPKEKILAADKYFVFLVVVGIWLQQWRRANVG